MNLDIYIDNTEQLYLIFHRRAIDIPLTSHQLKVAKINSSKKIVIKNTKTFHFMIDSRGERSN